MTNRGVNFQMPPRGQDSRAVDTQEALALVVDVPGCPQTDWPSLAVKVSAATLM
jgi:hypothetical protein